MKECLIAHRRLLPRLLAGSCRLCWILLRALRASAENIKRVDGNAPILGWSSHPKSLRLCLACKWS
jgi:hypothetical protein